jgi:hypothetical protein
MGVSALCAFVALSARPFYLFGRHLHLWDRRGSVMEHHHGVPAVVQRCGEQFHGCSSYRIQECVRGGPADLGLRRLARSQLGDLRAYVWWVERRTGLSHNAVRCHLGPARFQ